MKKLLLIISFCFIEQYMFAASAITILPSEDSSIIASNKIAVNHDRQILMYSLYNKLSVKEYQKLSGKKLNVIQKLNTF